MSPYCRVAVALPISRIFTYEIPDELGGVIQPGHRVLVPFGNRSVTGYVVEFCDQCTADSPKPILQILDDQPAFDSDRLALFHFVSDYYLCPLGEVIKTGLPAGINIESKIFWTITDDGEKAATQPGISVNDRRILLCMEPGKSYTTRQMNYLSKAANYSALSRLDDKGWVRKYNLMEQPTTKAKFTTAFFIPESCNPIEALDQLTRAPKQSEVFKFLIEVGQADRDSIQMMIPKSQSAIAALVKKGFIQGRQVECYRETGCLIPGAGGDEIVLNKFQRMAFDSILPALEQKQFAPFLIHGVTSSGKTEIYLQLTNKALESRRTVLVLVPEIALTPLLVSRFIKRFGNRVAVSHSGLSNAQRYDQWRRMLRKEADLCIGTRSAIFAPLENLGLIVVDEEHDPSYKQDNGVPYNARDLSLVLARKSGAVVVLGSATPSLESYRAAKKGKYTLLELPERATPGPLPGVEVVDMAVEMAARRKSEKPKQGDEQDSDSLRPKSLPAAKLAFSDSLIDELKKTLENNEQSILFLNRRGFSTHTFCLECRRTVQCPNCEVSLTPHSGGRRLTCHYCDFQKPANVVCEHCGGTTFFLAGIGTEQVQDTLQEKFPDAAIARLDKDTIGRKGALTKILTDFGQRRYDILIGTQIVTKGHDFPQVTLVGVLSADISMNLPDFRSAERTFQLISQVAGRAGRGDRTGKVIVQTFNPNHYAITTACDHDYKAFHKLESERRKVPFYPPYSRLALVRAKSRNEKEAKSFLTMVANQLRQRQREKEMEHVRILGPTASAFSRLANFYRFQLLIKSKSPSTLLSVARFVDTLGRQWKHSDIDWRIDIDPQNVL